MKISHMLVLLLLAGPASAQTNTIGNTGNVGIGTTSPAALLHVAGNSTTKLLLDNGVIISQKNAAGTVHNLLTHYNDDNVYLDNPDGALVLRAVGNVGIGTATPDAPLAVYGTTLTARFMSSTASALIYFTPASILGNEWRVGAGDVNPNDFGIRDVTAGETRFSITGTGNVGIGTTSPAAKLDVFGTGTTAIFKAAHGGSGASLFFEGTSATSARFTVDANFFRVTGFGNTCLYADTSSGNVGIGTANPTQKLSVNGTIHAKEVIVDSVGWSDYVFQSDYRLAPLSEVEGAIQKDGHLPGIPSAQEVAEHGVSMGEMQSKLLAKIEELTLHLIEMQKQNDALRSRVAALDQP